MLNFKKICLIAYKVIASCAAILIYSCAFACPKQQCVGIIDAGSTGTRLHVYAFDMENSNPTHLEQIYIKKITPSLSSLPLVQEHVYAYLDKLFSDLNIKEIPVHFYATGGMRLLPRDTQDNYYKIVKTWFDNHKDLKLLYAKTITGKEEGLFDWLAVNWQLGAITTSSGATVSVMDVGGASTQIIIPLKNIANIDPEDLVVINIYGKRYNLFVHSFLGIGQTLVTQQFLDDSHCFPDGYILSNNQQAHGDFSLCKKDIELLINDVHHVKDRVQEVVMNNKPQTWFVMGGIQELIQGPPLELDLDRYTYEFLAQQTDPVACKASWQDLVVNYPNELYLYTSCITPAYYYALMVDGYGINAQERINLLPNNMVADWTLGVVLTYKALDYSN